MLPEVFSGYMSKGQVVVALYKVIQKFRGIAISHANVMEYEQLDNGSLVVKGKDLDPKDFSCAVNYLTSPSR